MESMWVVRLDPAGQRGLDEVLRAHKAKNVWWEVLRQYGVLKAGAYDEDLLYLLIPSSADADLQAALSMVSERKWGSFRAWLEKLCPAG